MKRNQHQVTKKVSRNRAAPQSKTALALAFHVQVQGPEEVLDLKLDSWQSGIMRRAAGSAHIRLEEMFHFRFFRQLESFCGEHETYTVCGDAQQEVSDALHNGEK